MYVYILRFDINKFFLAPGFMQQTGFQALSLPLRSTIEFAERLRPLGYMAFLDNSNNVSINSESHTDIITAAPELMLYVEKHRLKIYYPDSEKTQLVKEDPFVYLETLLSKYSYNSNEKSPVFEGGLLGYLGYELNHLIEPDCISPRTSHLPDMAIGLYLWSLNVNSQQQTATVYFHHSLSSIKKTKILQAIEQAAINHTTSFYLNSPFKTFMSKQAYNEAFNAIKAYIYAGDCYQVNLTQRLTAQYSGDLWSAYKHLRQISPTHYSAYLESGPVTVLSHSPERYIKVKNRKVETKPIKGTSPRFLCKKADKQSAINLQNSEKDHAENLMIVDLLRNDLSHYCKLNSVKTPRLFALESYANVHHLVSTVQGILKDDATPLSLLKSSFPGGSITGAPKIRASQIIRELEPVARSVYCGAIGYIGFNGSMDTSIAIRTLVGDGKHLNCWGGGGIVADSVAEQEYNESIIKVQNLTTALEVFFSRKIR